MSIFGSTIGESLHSGRVLLMDGAMGTELQRAGIGDGECYEYWNLEHPEKVRAIHESYVAAGAEVLVTNTFQANPRSLERFGLAHELEKIAEAGIALAREVAGPDRFVLASVGPFPDDLSVKEIQRTVAALSSADGLLLETASTLRDLVVIHAHAPTKLPLLLSLTFCRNESGSVDLQGPFRLTMESINRVIQMVQLAALGVNCGREVGLDEVFDIVRFYCRATEIPCSFVPMPAPRRELATAGLSPHPSGAGGARTGTPRRRRPHDRRLLRHDAGTHSRDATGRRCLERTARPASEYNGQRRRTILERNLDNR